MLTYEREFVKGYHRKNKWQISIYCSGDSALNIGVI
jgi:hypothetical protein